MQNFFIFIISFYFLLISVIGYGVFFAKICFKKSYDEKNISIYIGFYGLMFITLISLFTSIFIVHNFYHNIIIHTLGFFYFFFNFNKLNKVYLKYLFYISLLTISALIISKTNDDFSYYHLPFTKYLTEQKIIFGMGHLNHGYNLLSSLFFLNSTFYLPLVKFFSFHFSLLFFLIFFNFFVLKEIFTKKKNKIIKYLYLFFFLFFNLSFNRIAEYGTDKVGQLLIVVLIIKLFELVCFSQKRTLEKILYLLPLFGFCITLKTYFLSYVLLGFVLIFMNNHIKKNFNYIIFSKSFLCLISLLLLIFVHHFISTGCFISPIAFTCFGDSTIWGREISDIKNLSIWLEQWAKAGAGPGYRTDNPLSYIQGFNWINNWIERYFIGKFTDQLGILFLSYLLIFFLLSKTKFDKYKITNIKKIIYFYSILILIFSVWFLNHPTLRYGGYTIFFLILSIPLSLIFSCFEESKKFDRNFKFLIIFIILIFNLKNFDRINKELNRNDIFKFSNFPFYVIKNKEFTRTKLDSGLSIYTQDSGHCWAIPTPCAGAGEDNLFSIKKNGYYFIKKN